MPLPVVLQLGDKNERVVVQVTATQWPPALCLDKSRPPSPCNSKQF